MSDEAPTNLGDLRKMVMRDGWRLVQVGQRADIYRKAVAPGWEPDVVVPHGVTPESYEWNGILQRFGFPTPCPTCGGSGLAQVQAGTP